MKMVYWAMIGMLLASILGSVAQVVLRKANVQFNISSISNWRFWIFLCLYGVGVLINIWAYRYGSPSILYPIIACSYVFVVLLSWMFLGDVLTWQKLTGSAIIVCGVILIASSV